MAEISAQVPDDILVAVIVTVAIDEDGPRISHAITIPDEEFDSVARASAPHALRRIADVLEKEAPRVVTLPADGDDDD